MEQNHLCAINGKGRDHYHPTPLSSPYNRVLKTLQGGNIFMLSIPVGRFNDHDIGFWYWSWGTQDRMDRPAKITTKGNRPRSLAG